MSDSQISPASSPSSGPLVEDLLEEEEDDGVVQSAVDNEEEDDVTLTDILSYLMSTAQWVCSSSNLTKIFLVFGIYFLLGVFYKIYIWYWDCAFPIDVDEHGHLIFACRPNATLFNTPFIVKPSKYNGEFVSRHLFSVFDIGHMFAAIVALVHVCMAYGCFFIARLAVRRVYGCCCARLRVNARHFKTQRKRLH